MSLRLRMAAKLMRVWVLQPFMSFLGTFFLGGPPLAILCISKAY